MKFILGENRGACRVGRECKYTIYRTRQNKFGLEEKTRRSYHGKTRLGDLRYSDPCCQTTFPFLRIIFLLYPNEEEKIDVEICAA